MVAGAATEVVRRLVAVVAGMLSGAEDSTNAKDYGNGRAPRDGGCSICSLKSLLHDPVSTAYATRNPSARAALLGVAASEVALKAAAAVTAADVRSASDTCATHCRDGSKAVPPPAGAKSKPLSMPSPLSCEAFGVADAGGSLG